MKLEARSGKVFLREWPVGGPHQRLLDGECHEVSLDVAAPGLETRERG